MHGGRWSLQKQKRLWGTETKHAEISCCHQLWINAFPERRNSPASLHCAPADLKKGRKILSINEATLPFPLAFFIQHASFPSCQNSLIDLGYYLLVLKNTNWTCTGRILIPCLRRKKKNNWKEIKNRHCQTIMPQVQLRWMQKSRSKSCPTRLYSTIRLERSWNTQSTPFYILSKWAIRESPTTALAKHKLLTKLLVTDPQPSVAVALRLSGSISLYKVRFLSGRGFTLTWNTLWDLFGTLCYRQSFLKLQLGSVWILYLASIINFTKN